MGANDRWTVDFYDMVEVVPHDALEEFLWFGDLHERAVHNGARHGTPILNSPTGSSGTPLMHAAASQVRPPRRDEMNAYYRALPLCDPGKLQANRHTGDANA